MAQKQTELPHGFTLQDRKKITMSGVSDVQTFDEKQVIIRTTQGKLVIRGSGLHVDQLSLETGDLQLSGHIDTMEYTESEGGFLRRIFQ